MRSRPPTSLPLVFGDSRLNEGNITKAAGMGVKRVLLSQQGDVAGYDRFIRSMHASAGGGATPGAGYTACATEGQRCSFSDRKTVAYGANGHWTEKRDLSNGTNCTDAVFGDPVRGVAKKCFIKN